MIRLEVDVSKDDSDFNENAETIYVPFGEFIVKEKMSVIQMKEQLLNNWETLVLNSKTNVPKPSDVHHLRIRDGKVYLVITSSFLNNCKSRQDNRLGRFEMIGHWADVY